MNSTRMVFGLGILISTSLITACHENPMNTHSKQQNIAFLRDAAINAEKNMKLSARKGGRFYSNCMEGNIELIDCEAFFFEMLRFSETRPEYRELTYSELTDAKSYASIAEDYQIKLFNSINY